MLIKNFFFQINLVNNAGNQKLVLIKRKLKKKKVNYVIFKGKFLTLFHSHFTEFD